MVPKTEKPKIQMQKYFIKPPTVDNKNPQQEKSQPPQQYSSSRNVDGQGSNLESQFMVIMMIFIYKGIFLPAIVLTMLRMFITIKLMLVAAMIIICQRWISRKIIESDGTEENNETNDEQSSYENC